MKTKTVAACQSCGAQMPKWVGRCPECDEWGSVVEEPVGPPVLTTVELSDTGRLAALDADGASTRPTGLVEVDRVLGGGLVDGSIVLLAGDPGVGKSTLSLQMAMALALECDVLLVCGEEAPAQVRGRAARIGQVPPSISTLADPQLPAVLGAIKEASAPVVVVDSIQTVFDPQIASAPGSVTQVRECGARLARAARDAGVTVLLVGHVTKEGAVAGPRVLEHLVDVVLQFEGDRSSGVRILRPLKNRFGSTQEVGFFDMRDDGLVPIRDASRHLLADRSPGLPGSVLAACVEGRRPFVCEIQALVDDSRLSVPRRVANGVDSARLPLLVAVLERRAGLSLRDRDVYVSAVGGLKITEPAADLPVAMAIASAALDRAVADDVVAFGEIGLAGEVRQVVAGDRRLEEAAAVGCARALVPHNFGGVHADVKSLKIRDVSGALEAIRDRW